MNDQQPVKDPYIILLPNVRLSFPALFTAVAMEEGKPAQFEATFLFDNTEHGALLDHIDKLIDRLALSEWKKLVKFKRCLRDGNERAETDGYGDGKSFLCARSNVRPAVINRAKVPVVEADSPLYAGCFCNATIRLFPWSHPTGGKGISAQLRAVMFEKDGPSFGAGPIDAESEFASIPVDEVNRELDAASRSGRSRSSGAPTSGRKPSASAEDY